MTCDPCLGLGYGRPRHFKCEGNGCSCCGEKPVAGRERKPANHTRKQAPKPKRAANDPTRIYKVVTPEDVAETVRLRKVENLTWREVGERMGRDPSGLRLACRRAGLDVECPDPRRARHASNPRSPDDRKIERARQLRSLGLSWREIGGALGVDHSYARKLVERTSTAT